MRTMQESCCSPPSQHCMVQGCHATLALWQGAPSLGSGPCSYGLQGALRSQIILLISFRKRPSSAKGTRRLQRQEA